MQPKATYTFDGDGLEPLHVYLVNINDLGCQCKCSRCGGTVFFSWRSKEDGFYALYVVADTIVEHAQAHNVRYVGLTPEAHSA